MLKELGDVAVVKRLANELGVSVPLAHLMTQRGIMTREEAISFFEPKLTDLHDPFLMKDMSNAVERLTSAINKNEKILIYGDYDVDGITAVSLVYSFWKSRLQMLNITYPTGMKGYGLSKRGLDHALEVNCKLVITLDCGIKSVDKIDYARARGMDVIVCDHHYPGRNPLGGGRAGSQTTGCNYPYKELSGCGVGFKLIHAYSKIHSIPFDKIINYLDLVG